MIRGAHEHPRPPRKPRQPAQASTANRRRQGRVVSTPLGRGRRSDGCERLTRIKAALAGFTYVGLVMIQPA